MESIALGAGIAAKPRLPSAEPWKNGTTIRSVRNENTGRDQNGGSIRARMRLGRGIGGQTMSIKLGSLFDGSGGFPLAGAISGIEPVWAAEVEPYPIAVTRSRFPQAEIRFIKGRLKFGGGTANAPFPSMVVIFDNLEEG